MLTTRVGTAIPLGAQVGSGGEARVYEVVGRSDLVAKIYHTPTLVHDQKLRAMLAAPPIDATADQGHISLAWPVDLVIGAHGQCVGFVMPRIDFARWVVTPSRAD